MKIKITQSPHSSTWYIDRIGEEFEVIDKKRHPGRYDDYPITKGGGVYFADFIIVDEFPTIKPEYFD